MTELRKSDVKAKPEILTIIEGIFYPIGTCVKGFEVVCNVLRTVMLTILAQTLPQSPQTESCQWGLPGQAYGCVVP